MVMSEMHNCSLQAICGGCFFGGMEYQAQLDTKEKHVSDLLHEAARTDFAWEGILPSPRIFAYRNKMEYSFGDEQKNGPLTLGLHKKRSFYDVVNTEDCQLVHQDFNEIVHATREYFSVLGLTYKDKRTHLGFLRHLLIRRAVHTGELLVDLVTTSQPLIPVMAHSLINDQMLYAHEKDQAAESDLTALHAENANEMKAAQMQAQAPDALKGSRKKRRGNRNAFPVPAPGSIHAAEGVNVYPLDETLQGWRDCLLKLVEEGKITGSLRGVLHTTNDSPSDAIKNDKTDILYGEDFINESLLGLKFKITPFSFFQTNSAGAEVLYQKARSYVSDSLHEDDTVYDLYSGTGTIAQMLAPCVKRVIGVEIIPEAVAAAKENAARNGLDNCSFLAGDVLEVLDGITEKPDVIILDPPRDGINPKALSKITRYGVNTIIYISCKCESLARDLVPLQAAGYQLVKACAVDQFPWTNNCETVCLLSKLHSD